MARECLSTTVLNRNACLTAVLPCVKGGGGGEMRGDVLKSLSTTARTS